MKAPLALLLLLLSMFASYSQQATQTQPDKIIPRDPAKPQFTIAAGDLASPAVLATNAPGSPHATIVVKLKFNAATTDAFKKFTRDHLDQQIEFIAASNVVAEPFIKSEIPNGDFELSFSSLDEAKRVRDALNRK